MPQRGNMKRLAQELFNEPLDSLIPRLIEELKTPHRVGVKIGVYSGSVRTWLINHGWVYENGIWVAPKAEAVHD